MAFFKVASKVRPLSLGIMDDLLDFYERLDFPPVSKKQLRQALSFYTASPAYLKSQKEGALRVDLSGHPIDVVDKEQQEYACEKLAARRQKVSRQDNKPAEGGDNAAK